MSSPPGETNGSTSTSKSTSTITSTSTNDASLSKNPSSVTKLLLSPIEAEIQLFKHLQNQADPSIGEIISSQQERRGHNYNFKENERQRRRFRLAGWVYHDEDEVDVCDNDTTQIETKFRKSSLSVVFEIGPGNEGFTKNVGRKRR